MKNLSEKELELMNHLWKIKKGFLKDIIEQYEPPRPAYTTIATMISRLITKKHIGFKLHHRDKEYFPILKKPSYFSATFKKMISNYFDGSSAQFASFFTQNSDLTVEQLEELKALLNQEIEKKNKQS